MLERLEGPHVILRGEALPRLTDGFRVVARWSTEGTERIFDGPLDEVASQLVEYLQGRSACTAMTPSASLRVPATSMLAYQRVASLALDSLLADDRNQATPPVPGQAGSAAEHARQLALAVPSSIVLQHLWASAAIRAYDADELPEEHWNLLLDRSDEQGGRSTGSRPCFSIDSTSMAPRSDEPSCLPMVCSRTAARRVRMLLGSRRSTSAPLTMLEAERRRSKRVGAWAIILTGNAPDLRSNRGQ